jgi:hypothetical protein
MIKRLFSSDKLSDSDQEAILKMAKEILVTYQQESSLPPSHTTEDKS